MILLELLFILLVICFAGSEEKDLGIGSASSQDRCFFGCYAWRAFNADFCWCGDEQISEECKYLLTQLGTCFHSVLYGSLVPRTPGFHMIFFLFFFFFELQTEGIQP